MNSKIVEYYENYNEEDRLSTNNARKIEFRTTTRIFDELFKKNSNILDCAAGTGAYAFYLAEQGHTVTATDITPRHIKIINQILASKPYKMDTAILDASDMQQFADETFDVVLNMGPFYHLTDAKARMDCLSESLRVLKKDGLLITAYIPRYYINHLIVMTNDTYLDARLQSQILETGILRSSDPKCFWTDSYYSSSEEMEQLYQDSGLQIIDHFAQDGLAPMFSDKIDRWNEKQFGIWCDYHYSVCREKSVLGMSNHVVIVGQKSNSPFCRR